MKREAFQSFLVTAYHGPYSSGPLMERSASSYCSNVARIEAALSIDLDICDLTDAGVSALIRRLQAVRTQERLSDARVSDCVSALKAYASFVAPGRISEGEALSRRELSRGVGKAKAQNVASATRDVLDAKEVLATATRQMGLSLAELVARCSIWARPDVVEEIASVTPHATWFPAVRRMRVGERRRSVVDGIRLDDNTAANLAIKLAVFGRRGITGFHACHVWPATCYSPHYHTSIANIVRSCPTAWCSFGGVITALSGKAGLVSWP